MPERIVDDLARSFERHLCAQNKSPRTVEVYLGAVAQFAAYLRRHRRAHGGRGLAQARGEDIEAFIVDLLGRRKPSTAHNRYRGLHAFHRWHVSSNPAEGRAGVPHSRPLRLQCLIRLA